jgi:hypothetical protein
MNILEVLKAALPAMFIYLALTLVFRQAVLASLGRRHAGKIGMETFLLQYHKAHRVLLPGMKFDPTKSNHSYLTVAWGMIGAGPGLFLGMELIQKGHPNGIFFIVFAILISFFQGHGLAKVAFATRCFRSLGMTSSEGELRKNAQLDT